MTTRFWVGGNGNWDATTTTHWSLTSGGTGGAAVPTGTEDVVIDANSGSPTITITANSSARKFNTTGATCTIAGSNALDIRLDFTLSTTTTWSNTGLLSFTSNNSQTITTNGVTISSQLQFGVAGSTGTYTLGSALTTTVSSTNFNLVGGTFSLGGFNLTCRGFASSNTNTRALDLSNTTITFTGSFGTVWDITTSTGMTLTSTSSTIVFSNTSSCNFIGGGLIYNNLTFGSTTANQVFTISGANTFNTLSSTKTTAWTLTLPASTITKVTNFSLSGTSGNVITLNSSTSGTQATISKTSGTLNVSYMNIQDSNATGGATWFALSSNGNTNSGNNTGWIFFNNNNSGNYFLLF